METAISAFPMATSSKPSSPFFNSFCCKSSTFRPQFVCFSKPPRWDQWSATATCKTPSTTTSIKVSEKKSILGVGIGMLAASLLATTPLNADATRIEYYATVGEPQCELTFAPSGLGYCDIIEGFGDKAPYSELINVHYTARFADGTVFDSSYKRGRPLTMRIGVGKVIRGLDQGIYGGEGVPAMRVGGKRRLQIPPPLAYGPEPAGCFSGDCNIPGNATLLYDIKFVELYSGNRPFVPLP